MNCCAQCQFILEVGTKICSICGHVQGSAIAEPEAPVDAGQPQDAVVESQSTSGSSSSSTQTYALLMVALVVALAAAGFAFLAFQTSADSEPQVSSPATGEQAVSEPVNPESFEPAPAFENDNSTEQRFTFRMLRFGLIALAVPLSGLFLKRPETLSSRRKEMAKKGW